MKILYVASNPDDAGSLNLNREITELQRRVLDSSAEPVSIAFMPGLKFEDLPMVLHRERPDILHLAAHGDGENLVLSNEAGQRVRVNAGMLRTFLSDQQPPRLVYINACDSDAICQGLVGPVHMAIGSTASITNRSARTAAVAFYERILDGSSVRRAFDVCEKMMQGATDNKAAVKLHTKIGIEPAKEYLHSIPRLIAEFSRPNVRAPQPKYMIKFGMAGCPSSTRQVVIFTDYEGYIGDDDNESLEDELCQVLRGAPARGVIWAVSGESWEVTENFRVYAVGVAGDERRYLVSATVCDALDTRYRLKHGGGSIPKSISTAITDLRTRDGSGLE